MNAIVQTLNTAGRTFVDFAVPMLIQSSVLILILLVVDVILRKRVRAVFRYWIWMLVLVKLVLPPSLWSPVSVGTWFGDKLEVSTAALLEHVSRSSSPRSEGETPSTPQGQDALATKASPFVTGTFPRAQREFIERPLPAPVIAPLTAAKPAEDPSDQPPAVSLNWQGLLLLAWLAVVTALLLLLAQRMSFVQGLVAQADKAGGSMLRELDQCRRRLGLRRQVALRLSPNATSPAVCGLLRPVILVPQNLASRLHGADLEAVFFHELAHVKRGDLWINVLQTLLQIVYFYNPFLWLANAIIRRIREKAVDETVLVAMGETAPQYPQTLVNVARLAFTRRPALSLRLIGVVESKSALTSRIQHILNRPIPKTARLGLAGLAVIVVAAMVLLPMAAAQNTIGSAATDTSRDSDGDGLSDYDEIHKYLTDSTKKDSDGDGTPDSDWNERREYTYSVRTVLRYLPPVDEKALNDDFQDGRVLKQTDEYIEVEVVHYPLTTGYDTIAENRNWRQDDAQMTEFLAPGATTNWDEPMRRDLLAALKADGIDAETLSDKQVVEQVSRWLLKRSRYLDKVFTTWYIHFPQGKPTVYPGLEDAFRREFERDKSNYDWILDQHFDHELLGKGMFYHKTHGSCTSTAIYLTTVLRALGIPTRMVLVAPAVDASDREQILMVKKALTHNRVRETMLAGLRRSSHGFTNHTLNEVYVGGQWHRLDYDQLGRPAFGADRFGLQTHLYTVNDLSDVNLAATWGVRYGKGEHNDLFRHDNPYSAVEVSELFGPHAQIPNPPFSAQESSSSSRPNIFLLYPGKISVWDDFIGIVKDSTWDKTGRPHAKENYDNLFEGVWPTKAGDILVLLFSLDTPERVPEGYGDLLPQPWAEIESQLQQGQTVELGGKAREKNVILLAAPTADGLQPLVQNSKLLRAIGGRLGVEGVPPSERGQDARDTGATGGASPAPGVGPTQPPAISPSAAKPVTLANGVTVELLGVCHHPSEGKQWWRPDGTPLDKAPYRTIGGRMEHEEGYEEYEFALRLSGPPGTALMWKIPGGNRSSAASQPTAETGERLPDIYVDAANQRIGTEAAEVSVGIASGPWQTVARHETLDHEGSYTLEGGRAIAFGVAYEKDGHTYLPAATNFQSDHVDGRVVAVDEEGGVHEGRSSNYSSDLLRSSTCRFNLPLRRIKAFHFRMRPWTWVTYKGVSLRPGRSTHVTVEAQDTKTTPAHSRRPPGQEKIVGIGPVCEVFEEVLGKRYGGSIGGFSTDPMRTKRYFDELFSWMAPGDILVLMLAFDKPVGVPPEYADLLPLPWVEIEKRVQKGQLVEAQGKARDLTVIVLAAPTSQQLSTLVRQTHLLDSYRADASREIVLPEVDRQPVVLDLATGALVPLPPVGPEPQKLEQALQKLGQGDFLYDCDSGDRTLILVRNATSAQAQGDTGEPPWKGYLIGPDLPAVLTIKTAEGRQYQVTILAADDRACTLKYSPVSTDKGAGGGALATPEKAFQNADLRSSLEADGADPQRGRSSRGGPNATREVSGQIVDPNGNPVAGAQVALCTKDKGVDIQAGQLLPTKWGGKGGEIVKTDAQGRFSFASVPDEFHLIAAHDQGFAWVTSKDLAASGALRLEPWGRIEGTLKIGRELGAGERISLLRGSNRSAADQNIHFDYETYADSSGQFTFEKVPPIWIEVGYLIRVGDAASSYTGRTPIHLLPGQSLKMTLGGEGRPVIGKFVPPTGYQGPIYFGQGLRALATSRPDSPKPANYDQMTKREQQEWLQQWYKTAEAETYYDTLWHDLKRRQYTFRIEDDGTFRIEDVIPGPYKFTVWLEERLSGQGRPEEIGAYYGTIEVPAFPGGRTDEPLDLGNLTLAMHNPPLHVGDVAPLFEAKSLDGKDIRLADYRGKFVLLSFWQPVSHPELDRLRELHKTYGGAGKLAIIDFGGWDTLEEVRKYVAERQMEWPEIYFGPSNKEGIANQYGLPGVPYILLVDPQGKIVATWLRGEKLTQAVTDAIGRAN